MIVLELWSKSGGDDVCNLPSFSISLVLAHWDVDPKKKKNVFGVGASWWIKPSLETWALYFYQLCYSLIPFLFVNWFG